MTNNEFDDILKNRLQQHESGVPVDMWQRITDNKEKRRVGFSWRNYIAVLLLLLIASGSYMYFTTWNKKTGAENSIIHSKNNVQSSDSNHNIQPVNNESVSTAGINKINSADLKINSKKQYELKRLLYKNKPLIKNNSEQTFITNNNTALQKQEYADRPVHNQFNADSIKSTVQKKQGNVQTTNSSSNESDSTEENEVHDKFSLQLFVSPDVPFSSISSSDNAYQELLRNSISMKLSYTIGAGISIAVSKKISLSTGVQYSRVNEKVSFDDSALTTHVSTLNHLDFINIPFIVKYKTSFTPAFNTSINAGILLNLSGKYKGSMPDAFGAAMNIDHDVYKTNTGISLYAGINFSKSISKKADVFAEPYFRYQTKNITENLQPFTRKINTAGIALGIQYRLFKNE